MKLKTVTLLSMIGAILSLCMSFFHIMLNGGIIEWSPIWNLVTNLVSLVSGTTLILFFYTLYKNQK